MNPFINGNMDKTKIIVARKFKYDDTPLSLILVIDFVTTKINGIINIKNKKTRYNKGVISISELSK